MKILFKDRMQRQMFYLISFLLCSFLIVLGIALIYTPPLEGQLTLAESIKKEAPAFADILSIKHGLTPTDHFLAMCCGLILPLFSFFYILYAVNRLQAGIILKKEYFFFIQTPKKQSDIVFANFLAVAAGLLLQIVFILAALLASSLIWDYWTVSFVSVLYVLFAMFSVHIFSLGWLLLGAALSKTGKLSSWFPFLNILWFIIPRISELSEKIKSIKYLSPFFASDVWKASNNFAAVFVLLAAGLVFTLIAALYFNKREFIKKENQP